MSNHPKIDLLNFRDETMWPGESQDFNADVSFLIAPLFGTKAQHFFLQQAEFLEVPFSLHDRVPKNHAFYVAPLRCGQSCQRRTQSKADHTDGEKTRATSQFDGRRGNIFHPLCDARVFTIA